MLGDALAAGALEENGEDHLYVFRHKRFALEARVADGGLEIGFRIGGPAEGAALPRWQLSHFGLHSCTGAKGRESERSAMTRWRVCV